MLTFELEHPTLRLGLVRVERVRSMASDVVLAEALDRAEQRVGTDPGVFPEAVRGALRDVLRVAGYKPTGRGKPASELLLSLAQKRAFPRINNLVDINNLVSLETALPISMFDADALGPRPSLRFARADERYVFNASGQSMELAGLPVVCRGPEREPVGNAVRDSMLCKVSAQTSAVFAVVYGSRALPEADLQRACERLAALLVRHAAGEGVTLALAP